MSSDLRPYRTHLKVMGQTSPPVIAQPVLEHVVGSSVADIGCGSGVFGYLMRVAWHFTGAWQQQQVTAPDRLVGLDFSPVAISRLAQFNIYDELVLADASTLPLPDKSVDTALSMENIEHLFPVEVGPALRELARVARRRIVISTPAPWMVINRLWLSSEIAEAEADPVPMRYDEFLVLAGCIHKAVIVPEVMHRLGFEVAGGIGRPTQVADSLVYWGDPETLSLDAVPAPGGMTFSGYPTDDGRPDWRDEYVRFLRASLAIDTSAFAAPRPSRRKVAADVVRLVRG